MGFSEHQVQEIIILGLVFFVSLVLSLGLTPLADRLAWKIGLIDRPGPRKMHSECVPRSGGLAIVASLFLTLFIVLKWGEELTAFWTGAGILILAGLLDDRIGVLGKYKFAAQILGVGLFMYISGYMLEDLGNVFGFGPVELGALAPWFTVFAMVGVINAFNLSDGLDGLAAGMAGIACLFFIPFAYALESWIYLVILSGFFGALLGFLRFNVQPARLFMGDVGSMFLGFSLAAAAVVLSQEETVGKQEYLPVTALIILSLPIWDTLFVMGNRIIRFKNPFRPDRTHLHHRLLRLGFSYEVTVSLIYVSMFFMGLCAWLARPLPEWAQFYSLLGFYILIYTCIWGVEKKTVRLGPDTRIIPSLGAARGIWGKLMIRAARHGYKVFAVVWAGFLLPAVFVGQNSGLGTLYYILFIAVLICLYYPWIGKKKHMSLAHGLIFFGIFSILLVYTAQLIHTSWYIPGMSLLAGTAAIWTLARVGKTPRIKTLLPSGFEFLLLGAAIVSPVLLHYTFDVDEEFRKFLVLSFVFSVPLFMLLKACLRRNPSSNRWFICYILLVLAVMVVL